MVLIISERSAKQEINNLTILLNFDDITESDAFCKPVFINYEPRLRKLKFGALLGIFVFRITKMI